MIKILFIFGTRPEAIKLCPVIERLRREPDRFQVRVCVTAQHRELLDQVLTVFGILPDYDLNTMRPAQTLIQSTAHMLEALEKVLQDAAPDLVLVQGDTMSTLSGAMAAFYAGIPIGHVEAGLRTGDMRQPFPEEMNRVLVSRLATLHFAATRGAAANLRAEGTPEHSISITGNTGIDAVLKIKLRLESGVLHARAWPKMDASRKLILVTAHRRESFGAGFERICTALRRLAARNDVQLIYPLHPNPNVSDPVRQFLGSRANILLVDPLDYVSFVDLMRRAYLILTDSGGIQEEAPSLGKPVLVLREKTERPEAVDAGTSILVGRDVERIVAAASLLLDDKAEYARRSRIHNPYGDGSASEKIAAVIFEFFAEQRSRKAS
ncbi:MAG TPA: UDP-N-acetylglucosamine 2-epimerase (non-hydrolyzing) [Acidobacteriaceae bacterium]|nr:UDP-N-acetylglucosamine 2-epimerase (non-hydrolyzing) [Acidobacteriaceae bacterium]